MLKAGVWRFPTTLFIRQYLYEHGEDYAHNIHKALKAARKPLGVKVGSYDTFRRTVQLLHKAGLIELAREEASQSSFLAPRRYWRLVKSNMNSPAWRNPRAFLYPNSLKSRPKGFPAIKKP